MRKLYFVCPTDCLERTLDKNRQENYYVTSLGNSVIFSEEMVEKINSFIESKGIKEITFVLSNNNRCMVSLVILFLE